MSDREWTLDVLADRVALSLERLQLGQHSGRVTERPDGRTIRYYTTLGLIDRPLGTRQRRKIYGERHRQQLIAIKHLQAKGLALHEIQEIMLAATPTELADLAQAKRVAPLAQPPDAPDEGAENASKNDDFWRARPSLDVPSVSPRQASAAPALDSPALGSPALGAPTAPPPGERATQAGALQIGAVTVNFPVARPLSAGDLAALLQAAGPLLGVLESRGLLRAPPPESHEASS